MVRSDWLIVAVAGATCSGKTTLARRLVQSFPPDEAVLLQQDDYFLPVGDQRHSIIPQLNHINFEILSSLDSDEFLAQINQTVSSDGPPRRLLVLDGFLVLNDPKIADLCDVKFFITLDKDTCWSRRSVRVYDPPDPPGYFELCVWPSYLQNFQRVEQTVRNVVYLSGAESVDHLLTTMLTVIKGELEK